MIAGASYLNAATLQKMTRVFTTLVLLLQFTFSFSQWTQVQQLPTSDIGSLYHKDNILYAGGKDLVYLSRDNGQSWDSTTRIPGFILVDNIIIYKNELYVTSFSIGVYKSRDGGNTWQNINTGIPPFVSDFVEWNGDLYASTLGSSVFKLDPINRNNWLPFNNGLSSLSANLNSIAGNTNALVAGTLANSLYDHLPVNSTTWEERFLLNPASPTEGASDIITAHDSLFLSGLSGSFYMSLDNGLSWRKFGNRLSTQFSCMVNAKQALLVARNVFNGIENSLFYYIKKDSLQGAFVNFSVVPGRFTNKMEIFGNKVWDASSDGLFYMSLSELPGITSDDSTSLILPVNFVSSNAHCDGKKVVITWKTAQEQNSSHFDIEKSVDAVRWSVIGTLPAAHNSNVGKAYSFADNNPTQNNFYRVAEYDMSGRVQYTGIIRSSCNTTETFNLWPNPVHDNVFVSIVSGTASQGTIRLFDSKGSLIKIQRINVLQGSNQFSVDMRSLPGGAYLLTTEWNKGQMKKALEVIKRE